MTQFIEAPKAVEQEPPLSESTPVSLHYADASHIKSDGEMTQLHLATNLERDSVSLDADISEPLLFRDCMRGLFNVVSSDYRYVPKDRAAYHAYRKVKNKLRAQSAWRAQQAYFDWLKQNDPTAYLILDPVTTLHPDEIFFEVFSKDEGAYAKFSLNRDALSFNSTPTLGTTNIDFSEQLFAGIEEIRSFHNNRLVINKHKVALSNDQGAEVIEKNINVPDSWIRGFLQVQTAATLSHDQFQLAAIDLYNILRHLRMHADQKGKRRGLRIELTPGQYPRFILEPWEKLLVSSGAKYTGKTAKVIRVWGRRRLMLLQNILPYAEQVEVTVLGNGLPSFWTLKSRLMSFTLGLTGFTSANWSQALNFDLLLPRSKSSTQQNSVLEILRNRSYATFESLFNELKLTKNELLSALQTACQQGWAMFDLPKKVYRFRPLVHLDLDQTKFEFRNRHDREAHDLIGRKQAITIEKENEIYATGTEITGKAVVIEDKREYQPFLLINEEGGVNRAICTCPYFRKHKLVQGPCSHLIALRLKYALTLESRLSDEHTREMITVQTRTFSKRDKETESLYHLSLDRKRLKIRWGISGSEFRVQNIQYNSTEEARTAYYKQITQLLRKSYLDLTAGK